MQGDDRRAWLRQWGVASLGALALTAIASLGLGPWEQAVKDLWFQQPQRRVALDPRIELVLVDDRSLEQLKAPTPFWSVHFARACANLINDGAQVVALDWLPYDIDPEVFPALAPAYPELNGVDTNPWMPLFDAVQKHGPKRMVQGIYPPNFQTSKGFAGASLSQYRPSIELFQILGSEQLGFLNASRDPDGVLRSQSVLPLKLSEPLWGVQSVAPLAGRVAELVEGGELQAVLPSWKGQPLPVDSDGRLVINYPPPGQPRLPRHSLLDVMKTDGRFKDKVVLIGPGSGVFQDRVTTPIGDLDGVEAHGYTLNTLLTGQFVHQSGVFWAAAATFSLVLLGAALGVFGSGIYSLAGLLLLEVVYYFALRSAFVGHNWLGPLLTPMLGAALGWSSGAALRARLRAQIEARVRNLFGRYVSPAVMEVLLKDPSQAALGAVGKRKITVLFSDINGFSGHCEKKTPDAIMTMLNRYFEGMNSIIFRRGGTIKQFVGDEIMAMYGAPLDLEKSEEAAVLTAVEMIRHLNAQQLEDPNEERGFYRIKVGIHCGEVILGNVGSLDRTEYAAVGDDVNLGSRIMGMTKALGGDILISRDVYDKVNHLPGLRFENKGSHPVKGRVEPIEIFQVIPEESS